MLLLIIGTEEIKKKDYVKDIGRVLLKTPATANHSNAGSNNSFEMMPLLPLADEDTK
jgi:hypothetical protein